MTNDKNQPEHQSNNSDLTGHRFKKGNSHGRGRHHGSRNKATLALQDLLNGEAEAITRKAVEMALSGDTTALRLCMERLIPAVRERSVNLSIPKLTTPADAKAAMNTILSAVANGSITPGEGQSIMSLVETYSRTVVAEDLQDRIIMLERKLTDGR